MDYSELILAMLAAGAVAGLLAGLFGVGGGAVTVPVLDIIFELLGVDSSVRMHLAIGTSLAIIIPTALLSARSHWRHDAVDTDIVRLWWLYIVIGAVAGTLLASHMNASVLYAVFAGLALIVSGKLLLPLEDKKLADGVPRGITQGVIPFFIGALSAIMGIGGGTFSVLALTLCGISIHRAVGTAALFGAFIALPAALTFIITGWGNPLLPQGSLGYINIIAFGSIVPASMLLAPLGARIAHRLPQRYLGVSFGVFLLIVAVRMGVRAFGE